MTDFLESFTHSRYYLVYTVLPITHISASPYIGVVPTAATEKSQRVISGCCQAKEGSGRSESGSVSTSRVMGSEVGVERWPRIGGHAREQLWRQRRKGKDIGFCCIGDEFSRVGTEVCLTVLRSFYGVWHLDMS